MTIDKGLFSTVEIVAATIQLLAAGYIARTASKGCGTKGTPYGPGGVPEAKYLGCVYCLLQMAVHCIRGAERLDGMTDIRGLWYLDYLFQCPLILCDMMFALRMPRKLLVSGTCAAALVCAAGTFYLGDSGKYVPFGYGLVLLISLFTIVVNELKARFKQLPSRALGPLYVAMSIFFGMWPAFPIMWILGFKGAGVIGKDAYQMIHVFLDVCCKSVFGIALMRFRQVMEDTGTFYGYTIINEHYRKQVVDLAQTQVEKQAPAMAVSKDE